MSTLLIAIAVVCGFLTPVVVVIAFWRWQIARKAPKPPIPAFETCRVIEKTADGLTVGRCWFYLANGVCPRHGKPKEDEQ